MELLFRRQSPSVTLDDGPGALRGEGCAAANDLRVVVPVVGDVAGGHEEIDFEDVAMFCQGAVRWAEGHLDVGVGNALAIALRAVGIVPAFPFRKQDGAGRVRDVRSLAIELGLRVLVPRIRRSIKRRPESDGVARLVVDLRHGVVLRSSVVSARSPVRARGRTLIDVKRKAVFVGEPLTFGRRITGQIEIQRLVPAHARVSRSVVLTSIDIVIIIVPHIHGAGQAHLLQVAGAGCLASRAAGLGQRRQKHAGQNCDDRNHHQQLDQRE